MTNIKYFYLHDSKRQRHVTVAYTRRRNTGSYDNLLFALAVSHPSDRFKKSIGRNLSTGRLLCEVGNKEAWVASVTKDQKSITEILNILANGLPEIPQVVSTMAKRKIKEKRG